MATAIRMPDVGTVEGEVVLSRWLKAEGQAVRMGEPLLEVETDKGVNEIESVADGVLLRRMATEGAKVAAGELIAWVGAPGEVVADAPRPVEIAPALKQLAAKRGVDLAAVRGTGPGGAVTRADILAAVPAASTAPAPAHHRRPPRQPGLRSARSSPASRPLLRARSRKAGRRSPPTT